MPSWLPSYPYPPPDQHGYWNPVTSTLNWCEEDYYLTYYAAEIVNTLTNAMFIYLAYQGVRSCRKYGHDSIFEVAYYGYFLVGFGSFMFHATLKYPWQLVDELNMIYTTCLMVYASFSYSRSNSFRIVLGTALIALCAFITVYYHYLQDPVFHQNVYAILTFVIVFRSIYIMEMTLRPQWRGLENASGAAQKRENEYDSKVLKDMWILVAFGLTIFLSGFAIWGVDNVACSTLRQWRRSVGMPWGFLLEGHGWWHLMTGVGAYCYIVWGTWLRHCLNGDQRKYVLVWPALYRLPEVVTADRLGKRSAALANGEAKKTS